MHKCVKIKEKRKIYAYYRLECNFQMASPRTIYLLNKIENYCKKFKIFLI